MKKKIRKQKKVKKASVKQSKALKVSGNLQLLPPPHAVEITRSFSFKLNCGTYESRDFFCSQKSYAKPEEAEKVSEALYQFCKREVLKSVNEYRKLTGQKSKDEGRDSAEHEVGQ
mgnify:CR=1 FL=1